MPWRSKGGEGAVRSGRQNLDHNFQFHEQKIEQITIERRKAKGMQKYVISTKRFEATTSSSEALYSPSH